MSGGQYKTINYPGATGTRVFDINSQGQIVGWFFDAGGNSHGFMATPR